MEFDQLLATARAHTGPLSNQPRAEGRHRLPDAEDFNWIAQDVRHKASAPRRRSNAKAYELWETVAELSEYEDSRPDGDEWRAQFRHLIEPLESADEIDRQMVYYQERLGLRIESGADTSLLRRAVVVGRSKAYHDLISAGGAMAPSLDADAERHSINVPKRKSLRDVLDAYAAAGTHDEKWLKVLDVNVEEFEEFIGEPRPINRIKRQDIQSYTEALQRSPANRKQRFPGMTMKEAVNANANLARPHPLLSRSTIQTTKLASLATLFRFAMDQRQWIQSSPAERIKIARGVKEDRSKHALSSGELNRLFEHPIWSGCADVESPHKAGRLQIDDHRFWAPLVLLFTGCRPSELGGIALRDVVIDGPSPPHFNFRIDEHGGLKTANAQRQIPIMNALKSIGFFDYVARMRAVGSARLFPQWERGGTHTRYSQAAWVRAFNRTVLPAQLGESASARYGLYSFRKCFKLMMFRSNVPGQIQTQLMGHQARYDDKAYIQTLNLDHTYPAICDLNFDGVDLAKVTRAPSR